MKGKQRAGIWGIDKEQKTFYTVYHTSKLYLGKLSDNWTQSVITSPSLGICLSVLHQVDQMDSTCHPLMMDSERKKMNARLQVTFYILK